MTYRMETGYCFVGPDWEIDQYTAKGTEKFLRTQDIDGVECAVFECEDKVERAQLAQCCRH
jgi:hypothetical protein